MFCVSESSGFGMSPTVGLVAFKPIFVDLALPYSVIRGESFMLTATVFNYLKHCMRVRHVPTLVSQVQWGCAWLSTHMH